MPRVESQARQPPIAGSAASCGRHDAVPHATEGSVVARAIKDHPGRVPAIHQARQIALADCQAVHPAATHQVGETRAV